VVLAYNLTFGLLALMMLYPVVEGFLGLHGGAGGEVASSGGPGRRASDGRPR
jgi:hypothetical protein